MMNIVEDNLKYMSKRQQKHEKAARKAFQAISTLTIQDLKAIIRMNLINNSEITTEDVNLAKKLLGPDVNAIKGKTTQKVPLPAFSDVIDIPEELLSVNREVGLTIDGLTVNSLKSPTTISHDITY